MRLDKFLSITSGLSRSESKKALKENAITLNGNKVVDPKLQIKEDTDLICLYNQKLTFLKNIYIVMNKPQGVVCSTSDRNNQTVNDLLTQEMSHRQPHSVGRLDKDTTGLVLLTDDGKWTHRITSPKKKCTKIYEVDAAEPIDESYIKSFADGVMIADDDMITLPAHLEIVSEHKALLSLVEGRYHQVKKMFASVGNHVNALHRRQIGGLALPEDLEVGQWRLLTEDEKEQVFK